MTLDLDEMARIANKAMDLAAHLFATTTPDRVAFKGDRDAVSNVDLHIERELRAYLRDNVPTVGFLGEEEGVYGAAEGLFWALDPIDGTANFIHGVPLSAISLALVQEGIPIVGVISTPIMGRRYTAVHHGGSWVDSKPVSVSNTTSLRSALVSIGDYAVGADSVRKNARRIKLTALLAEKVERIRMFGSAAIDLAWVADGRTDAMIMLSNNPWDTAAGVLIAREAGATVVDHEGKPHNLESLTTVAANPRLIDAIVELIARTEGV